MKRSVIIPEIKKTNISMEWTDTGALINSSIPMRCPVCEVEISTDYEHRCGEFAKPKRVAKKKGGR